MSNSQNNNARRKSRSSIGGKQHVQHDDKSFKYSLFRKNPNVPQLKDNPVIPITEPLFSGKTFRDFDLHAHMVSKVEYKGKYFI